MAEYVKNLTAKLNELSCLVQQYEFASVKKVLESCLETVKKAAKMQKKVRDAAQGKFEAKKDKKEKKREEEAAKKAAKKDIAAGGAKKRTRSSKKEAAASTLLNAEADVKVVISTENGAQMIDPTPLPPDADDSAAAEKAPHSATLLAFQKVAAATGGKDDASPLADAASPTDDKASPLATTDGGAFPSDGKKKEKAEKSNSKSAAKKEKPLTKGLQRLDMFFRKKTTDAEVVEAVEDPARNLEAGYDDDGTATSPTTQHGAASAIDGGGGASVVAHSPDYYYFCPFTAVYKDPGMVIPAAQHYWAPETVKDAYAKSGRSELESGFSLFGAIDASPPLAKLVNPFLDMPLTTEERAQQEFEELAACDDDDMLLAGSSKPKAPVVAVRNSAARTFTNLKQFYVDARGLPVNSKFKAEIVLSAWFSQNWEKVEIRPPYYGTWNSRASAALLLSHFARYSAAKGMTRLSVDELAGLDMTVDYDADSGDEWDDEPEGDADDLASNISTSDASSGADGDDALSDNDLDKFIDDNLECEDSEEDEDNKEYKRALAQQQQKRKSVLEPKIVTARPSDLASVILVKDPTEKRVDFSVDSFRQLFAVNSDATEKKGKKERKKKKGHDKDGDEAAPTATGAAAEGAAEIAAFNAPSADESQDGKKKKKKKPMEKKFFCPSCGRGFAQEIWLTRHLNENRCVKRSPAEPSPTAGDAAAAVDRKRSREAEQSTNAEL